MANTFREDLVDQETQASRFILNMDKVSKNPSEIQRLVIQEAEDQLGGEVKLVDASNPFVYLSSVASASMAAFVIGDESAERRLYPVLAQTPEDLYYHMSDKDYIDRFAAPAFQDFYFMVRLAELQARLVTDPVTGIKRVRVPRYSKTSVMDFPFSLLYNIDIVQYTHGSWGVLYDGVEQHPLQSLDSNAITWEISKATSDDQAALIFQAKMAQVLVGTREYDVNISTGFKRQMTFVDSFCYARVFVKGTGGTWKEIKTTHSDFTYDASTPTAILKVLAGKVEISIPQVYLNKRLVTGAVRVDVYSTKGEMSLNTVNLLPSAFVSDWNVIDKAEQTREVAAWQVIRDKTVYARAMIVGGKGADSFETLRTKVIMNTVGQRQVPITDAQITTAMANQGFDIVKYTDTLTERFYHATRSLPKSFDEKLVTAGNASIETMVASMGSLANIPGVLNNGERITLSPDVIYRNNNGIIQAVTAEERAELDSLSPDAKALAVTNGNYLFTPFHYVLDPLDGRFESRPYYLGDPYISSRLYIDQNDRTGLQVGTQQVTLEATTDGYNLIVVTTGNKAWTELDDSQGHAQISFIPNNESARAFVNGDLVARTNDNNFIFQFKLETGFDITSADNIVLGNFKIVNLDDRLVFANLSQTIDLVFSSSGPVASTWVGHSIDDLLGKFLLPNRIAAVCQEKITVDFGKRLDNLWAASRSFAESAPYQTYSDDIFAVYEEDVYEIDPVTGMPFQMTSGGIQFMPIIHSKGSVVMVDGKPQVKHKKGSPILDSNGKPKPVGEGYVTRQLDIFFIEGAYFFATDFSTETYREQMVRTVVKWITESLTEISRVRLEQTKIFFYPKTTMGTIRGIVADGQIATLQAAQSFNVKLSVSKEVNNNAKLKDNLTTTAIRYIDAELKNSTVSMSSIVNGLVKAFGNDVIAFTVNGLGGSGNYDAFTSLDDRQRCAIKKRLFAQPNGELIVREDVNVEFIQHTQKE